jgi:hypothetical protein
MSTSIVELCAKIGTAFFKDPIFTAMRKNEVLWGDLLTGFEAVPAAESVSAVEMTTPRRAPRASECPGAPMRKVSWEDESVTASESEAEAELDTSAEIGRESDDESEVSYGRIVFFKPDEDDMPWLDKSEPVSFKAVDDEFDFIPAVKRKSFKTPSFVGGAKAPTPFPAGRRTLMAKNLPRESITVAKLRKVFEQFGTLKDVFIPLNMDKSSPYFRTVKGFAKIEFLTAESAEAAYNKMFGSLTIDGCLIGLEPAKEDRT